MAKYILAAIETATIVARLKKEMCDWEEAELRYKNILDLATQVLNKIDELNEDEKKVAFNTVDDAIYNLAFVRYVDHDYAAVINMLTSSAQSLRKSQILLGLCYCKVGFETKDINLSKKAAELLVTLETQEEQLFQEGIDSMDDNLLAEAYFQLSNFYNYGIGVSKSTEKAYLTIERGLKNIKGDLREMLEKEKSHYKKTFFGGWEYR